LLGIRLVAMANAMGMSSSGLSRIETGNTAVTVSQLRKVARELRTTASDVVRQAEEMAAKLSAEGVSVR